MDYEKFKDAVYQLTNINLSAYKEKQMKRRIDALIFKNSFSTYDKYFEALKTNEYIHNEFINYLTINVSEFYRNPTQWEVLDNTIMPIIKKSAPRNIKIWSSACSTGDEPYTLAMVFAKHYDLKNIEILATDIDDEAIKKAQNGLYTKKSIEKLPSEFIEQYFKEDRNLYKVNDELKTAITFKKMNLLEDEYPKDYDIIVCRNVLIYFTGEAKAGIYEKFYKSMKDTGILFVGSTEQIILSKKYNFCPVESFFYRKMKKCDEE